MSHHQTDTRGDHTTGTKGAITDPERRLAPESIAPWTDADCEQERGMIATLLREVDGMGADIAFPAKYYVDCVGEDLGRLDSENALLHFDNDTLHKPAARLLRALLASDHIRAALARRQPHQQLAQHQQPSPRRQVYRPGMVSFTNHLNRLRQTAGRKRKRDAAVIAPVLGPADVFCIFEPNKPGPSDNINVSGPSAAMPSNTPELLFLKEAKASHKLTEHVIDQAVAGAKILEPRTIMGRGGGDTDDPEDCEYWFAAVCAQIYTSMIDKGLRYGIISTGARYVFVSIDPDDLSTLRYSPCCPSLDIAVSPLLRIVSLALLALQNGPLPDSRHLDSIRDGGNLIWTTATVSFTTGNSPEGADTESWKDSPAHMNDQSSPMPDQPSDHDLGQELGGRASQSLPATPPRSHPAAVEARRREALYPSPPPQDDSTAAKRPTEDDTDVDSMMTHSAKRIKTNDFGLVASLTSPSSPVRSSMPAQYISPRDRQFCTQECLQSLQLSSSHAPADTACPNWAEHQGGGGLTGEQLCEALRVQLTASLKNASPHFSRGYEFLNFVSGHTQIVKLRLGSSGHVLLAKAFMPSDLRVMQREARCYHHLRHLQGKNIPVYMGTIELPLKRALTYDGFRFTGLLLLSWAGIGPDQWSSIGGGVGYGGEPDYAFTRALQVEVSKALSKIHEAGILHRDVALRNVLVQHYTLKWTPRPEWRLQVSIIDFELSRTRAMYKHHETQRRRQRGPPTRDLDREFAEALDKEMDACADTISKWCPNKQIDA